MCSLIYRYAMCLGDKDELALQYPKSSEPVAPTVHPIEQTKAWFYDFFRELACSSPDVSELGV